MKHFLVTVLAFLNAYAAHARIYELTFQRVATSSELSTCQGLAKDTAESLRSLKGVTIVDHGCRTDDYTLKGLDAVVTYQSTTRLGLVSTYSPSVYSAGFYSTRRECEQRLQRQRDIFAKATGIEPLTSYCRVEVSHLTPSWTTVVAGVGVATRKPGVTALSYWGTIENFPEVMASYQTAVTGYGLTLMEAGVDRSGLGRHLVIRYFASEPFSLHDYHEMKYDDVRACRQAASAVNRLLQRADKPIVTFCEKVGGGEQTTLHITNFKKMLDGVPVYDVNELPTPYASEAACSKAAEEISSLPNIFGAVCAGTRNAFHVFVFGPH